MNMLKFFVTYFTSVVSTELSLPDDLSHLRRLNCFMR